MFIIREVNSDMPSKYIQNKCWKNQTNRSDSQSERPWSKCLVIDVPFAANIRLRPMWLPR